jgi:hypothetical protein
MVPQRNLLAAQGTKGRSDGQGGAGNGTPKAKSVVTFGNMEGDLESKS